MANKKRKLKKPVKYVILVAVLLLLLLLCILLFSKPKEEPVVPTPTPTAEPTPTPTPVGLLDDAKVLELHEEVLANKEINSDIVGTLYFNSGIIYQPVVYDPNNATYLRANWKTMGYDAVGTAFMDFRNDLSLPDQNTLIYGHYVYESYSSDRTLMFTPLGLFRDKANYEPNRYFAFVTENDVRYYEVAVALDCPVETINGVQYAIDELQYNLIDYEEGYFNAYTQALKNYAFYDTGVELMYEDKLLTLQTCVEGAVNERLVVIAREIFRKDINDIK